MKKDTSKGNKRNILYFSLLGVEIAFVWFFITTMKKCRATIEAALVNCASIKAYLILIAMLLLVIELAILIFYEKKQRETNPFGKESKSKIWIYLLIVVLLVLAPIMCILIF